MKRYRVVDSIHGSWRRALLAGALGALLNCPIAGAQVERGPLAPNSSVAEALFQEAKQLMHEKRYADACPKLEESYRLEPGAGTLLNLAVCHEREGKVATAWAEYHEALVENRRLDNQPRVTLARRALAELEPRLPRLELILTAGAAVAGLEFTMDDVPLSSAAFGVKIPVDPGVHVLAASAPGRKPWKQKVTLEERRVLRVQVPVLQPANPVTTPAPSTKPGAQPDEVPATHRPLWGLVVGGAGLAALGVGAGFGLSALNKGEESTHDCTPQCSSDAIALNKEAKNEALVADISIGAGAVGLAVGLYLLISNDDGEATAPPKVSEVRPRLFAGSSVASPSLGLEYSW